MRSNRKNRTRRDPRRIRANYSTSEISAANTSPLMQPRRWLAEDLECKKCCDRGREKRRRRRSFCSSGGVSFCPSINESNESIEHLAEPSAYRARSREMKESKFQDPRSGRKERGGGGERPRSVTFPVVFARRRRIRSRIERSLDVVACESPPSRSFSRTAPNTHQGRSTILAHPAARLLPLSRERNQKFATQN